MLLLLAAPLLAERAVRRDGEVIEGELLVSIEEKWVAQGKKSFPLEAFHLVEQDDGRLVWAPDFRARMRGYEFLARHRGRGALADLAREAAKLGAPDLAAGLLRQAEAAGLPEAEADAIAKQVRKAKRKDVPKEERERLAREAAAAQALLPGILAGRAAPALAAPESREDGLRLLREALLLAPELAEARRLLAEHAPKEFALGDARFWLDWHLDLEALGGRPAPEDELELKRARAHWRPDLYGVVAPPVLLVTPVRDTRVVGRCLAFGRLTCETLAGLFATDRPRKRQDRPLTIFLYSDKEEYKKKSGTYGRIEDRTFLEWTAGHYSPQEQVSRFYWYADRNAERRIVGTCVHEITHHWIEEQNPRFAASEMRGHGAPPGHWIVEGFATLMEEGRYSPEKGTADLFNPRSRSLDIVQALAGKGALIDWKGFYALTERDFAALPVEHGLPVVRKWSLRKDLYSVRRLFYEQGAATCAYLFHAEDGKYRSRLLDYVVHYYTGQREKLDPAAAFGMAPEELGKRVEEFAKQVAEGWKP